MKRIALDDPRFHLHRQLEWPMRNDDGFSSQDHFVGVASDGNAFHISALRNQSVVYTSMAMIAPPSGAPQEGSLPDSSNATV